MPQELFRAEGEIPRGFKCPEASFEAEGERGLLF
jgi:hypothetical protein